MPFENEVPPPIPGGDGKPPAPAAPEKKVEMNVSYKLYAVYHWGWFNGN